MVEFSHIGCECITCPGWHFAPYDLHRIFTLHLIASALLSFFKNICGINKHHRNKGLKFFHGKYD